MKILKRIFVLAAGSLIAGFLVNQLLNEGIPWRLLVPAFSGRNWKNRVSFFDAETAFRIANREPVVFIDIRPSKDFNMDRIQSAKNMPFAEFFRHPSRFPLPDKDTLVIVYDFEFGSRKARILTQWLSRNRFLQVNMLYSGFSGWIEAGLPMERGKGR